MPLDLTDDEKAALIELLRAQTKNTRWAAPHITELRAILAKLDPPAPRPEPLPAAPNPRSRQGAALAKRRQR